MNGYFKYVNSGIGKSHCCSGTFINSHREIYTQFVIMYGIKSYYLLTKDRPVVKFGVAEKGRFTL